MTPNERKFFMSLRRQVADYIREALQEDGCCKSYEGTWELLVSYPNYFDDETAEADPDFYQIALHCYVLGPGRHYTWSGKTWMEVLRKCKQDIDRWVES